MSESSSRRHRPHRHRPKRTSDGGYGDNDDDSSHNAGGTTASMCSETMLRDANLDDVIAQQLGRSPLCGPTEPDPLPFADPMPTEEDIMRAFSMAQINESVRTHEIVTRSVSVRQLDARRGRGVLAKSAFQANEVVFTARPDISVLYNPYMRNHCNCCFRRASSEAADALSDAAVAAATTTAAIAASRPSSSSGDRSGTADGDAPTVATAVDTIIKPTVDELVVCNLCQSFALCADCGGSLGEEMSNMLWVRHRQPCLWLRSLPRAVRAEDTDYVRFVLEFCARVQKGDTTLLNNISDCCSNAEAQSAETKSFCVSFARLCVNQFGKLGLIISQEALADMLLRVKCNALGFPFSKEATLGWSMQRHVCMINHSCNPNSALTQSPLGEMRVQALRSIEAGEEITISYIHVPDFDGTKARRRELLEKYRFLCQCEVCAPPPPPTAEGRKE